MKKIIAYMTITFAMVLVINCILANTRVGSVIQQKYMSNIGNGYTEDHVYKKIGAVRNNKYDILYMGSSHVAKGIMAVKDSLYGYKSYNMGSSSQTNIASYMLYSEMAGINTVEYMIIDVMPEIMRIKGIDGTKIILKNMKKKKNMYVALNTASISVYTRLMIDMCRVEYKRNIINARKRNDVIKDDGQVCKVKISGIKNKTVTLSQKKVWYQKYYLEKLIRKIQEDGRKVIPIIIPVTKKEYERYKYYEKDKKEIKRITDKYGLKILDFNEYPELQDTSLYYDWHHLNEHGSEVFHDYLWKRMLEEGVIERRAPRDELVLAD